MDTEKSKGSLGGTILAALFGFLGIVSSLVGGSVRITLLIFASVGIAYCLVASILVWRNGLVLDWWRDRWHRTHYRCTAMHMDVHATILEESHVFASLLLPNHWTLGSTYPGRTDNPLAENATLRCEFRRSWSLRRVRVTPRPVSAGQMCADFPDEFTELAGGRRRVTKGHPYIVRWKIAGRHRALARRTVGYNGNRYIEHVLLRLIHSPRVVTAWIDAQERRLRPSP